MKRLLLPALGLVLAVAAALPAPSAGRAESEERPPAPWIVTTSGERIELRGPWRIDGQRVIFTTREGTLSAMRLSYVDLERSRVPAEQPPAPPAPAEKAASREPALVLDEKNTAAYGEAAAAPGSADPSAPAAGGEAGAAGAAPAPAESAIKVVAWSDVSRPDDPQISIYGTVRNGGSMPVHQIRVVAELYDEANGLITSQPARLVKSSLDGGGTTNFRVFFADVASYARAEFRVLGGPSKD